MLAAAIAATTALAATSARAGTAATDSNAESLRLLAWSPSATQEPLLDVLTEHDRKAGAATWPRPLESAPGVSLLDSSGPTLAESPARTDRPIFGSLGTPIGRLSVVSEKLDDNGRIKGLDFMRLDVPGWDIGVQGSKFKISHRWGAKGGDRPFANREKHRVSMPN